MEELGETGLFFYGTEPLRPLKRTLLTRAIMKRKTYETKKLTCTVHATFYFQNL